MEHFIQAHPFLTFFIVMAVISGIVTIIRGRGEDDD